MIVKNEEKFIRSALASAVDIAHEMIVVDTGSSDKTVEIAKEMGAKVFSFEWSDDFAAARNFALSKATGDWIFQLDGDEELHSKDRDALRKLADTTEAGSFPISAYKLKVIDDNVLLEATHLLRFFKRYDHIRYIGRIHEYPEIINGKDKLAEQTSVANIRIIHHGYDPSRIDDGNKRNRNFQLLEKSLVEEPENLHYLYHMGQELLSSGKLDQAAQYLYRAYQHKDAGTMAIIFRALPLTLIHLGKASEALSVLNDAKKIFPNWQELDFLSSIAHMMNFELVEAEAGFNMILESGAVSSGRHDSSDSRLAIPNDLPTTAGSMDALPNFYLFILAKMRGNAMQADNYFSKAISVLEKDLGMIYFIFASMIPVFNENIVKDEVLRIIRNSPAEIKQRIRQLFN